MRRNKKIKHAYMVAPFILMAYAIFLLFLKKVPFLEGLINKR
jgi:hypothetical protein